jgi:nitrogen-specific signal transduction histidine kinase/CheY-like chemotaxis protein
MVDITERKAAAEAMLQTQKLESLGVMAGGIAHDFNNLLVGILGNAGLALNELPPDSPAFQYIQDLERASQRAADLTRQMLAYSGRGKLVTAPFDVSDVVQEMSRLLEAVIPKSVVLELALGDQLPLVDGDVAQFRQVVMNLIINAAEAVGERSGFVNVSTGSVFVDADSLQAVHKANDMCAGEHVFVEVADNGSGLTQGELEKIFDPFYTTKFTGRGLGLAVVLGIVRSHRGAIQVDSRPGEGTTFRVLLPVSKETAPRHDGPGPEVLDWRGRGTVLVVDDEPAIRTVAKRILTRVGMKAVLARDGREGARLFGEMADEIDLVILDLTMPRMSGEEALQKIREIRPDAKVLLTSGYSEQDAVSRFTNDELAGFLQKPYTMIELIEKIRDIVESTAEPPA